jgi:hypothetical protein
VDRVTIHEAGADTREALLGIDCRKSRRSPLAAYAAKSRLATASADIRVTDSCINQKAN